MRERELDVAGVRTRVLEAGPQERAEAVVLVHGNPGSAQDWEELLPRLGTEHRALALDQPAFGRADAPPAFEHTVAGHALFLGAALERLGVHSAHLVLHDFGGAFGLAWAVAHPGALASVTLIDTGILPGYRWHSAARIWRTPLLGELAQATTTGAVFRRAVQRGSPRPLPAAFVERMATDYDRDLRRAVLRLYRSTDLRAMETAARAFRELDPPTLVLWGAHDPYIGAAWAARQRDAFPRAEVHVLDGCGHWPFVDEPERVAGLLGSFLARASGRPT
ncbi:MAG: alpha/beta hydrolase [Thermoleophilia bacterium]